MTPSFDDGAYSDAHPRTSNPLQALRPRRSRAARVFRWWLVLSALACVACALGVLLGLAHADFAPLHIVINDDDLTNGISVDGLAAGGWALLAIGGLLLALVALLVIPLLLAVAVGAVAVALACAVALPLAALTLVLGVATSPLWLVALLIGWIVRRRPSAPLAGSARMAA